ncbi:MAG TPA: hypothetical protein DEA55_03460, partial [Rhodospirillaceae bacterium]|nr:hypothetical protein [Rhodospirillaceae bacterium]
AEEQTNSGPAHVGIEQRREEFREKVTGTENDTPAAQIEPAAGETPAADEAAAAATQEQPEAAPAQEQPAEPAADENK